MIQPCRSVAPRIHPSAWGADSAQVIGDGELAEDVSVRFTALVRGDVNFVRVGRAGRLHGGTIASHCLLGIGAIVLDGAEVGDESIVAGALVAPGTKIPPRSLIMGAPARVKREVSADDVDLIHRSADHYVSLKNDYLAAARMA